MAEAYNCGMPIGTLKARFPCPVGTAFCVPYVAQFVMEQRGFSINTGRFPIKDAHGHLLFQVERMNFGLHSKRILRDSKGTGVVLLKKKRMSMHDRWEAYDGENPDLLLFIMKKPVVFQPFLLEFDVFLPSNVNFDQPDFTIREDSSHDSYFIRHNDVIVAEVSESTKAVQKGRSCAKVYPGVDHAFIASVLAVVQPQSIGGLDSDRDTDE